MDRHQHADRWKQAAADIQARWAHGHDELTNGCSLCNGEFDEVMAWVAANPLAEQ